MRDEQTIDTAHRAIVEWVTRHRDDMSIEDMASYVMFCDFLCWARGHKHETAFGNMLDSIARKLVAENEASGKEEPGKLDPLQVDVDEAVRQRMRFARAERERRRLSALHVSDEMLESIQGTLNRMLGETGKKRAVERMRDMGLHFMVAREGEDFYSALQRAMREIIGDDDGNDGGDSFFPPGIPGGLPMN